MESLTKLNNLQFKLQDVASFSNKQFYEELKGKPLKAGKEVRKQKIITLLHESIAKTLTDIASSTAGNSLHLVSGKAELLGMLTNIRRALAQQEIQARPGFFTRYLNYDDSLQKAIKAFDTFLEEKIGETRKTSKQLFEEQLQPTLTALQAELVAENDQLLVSVLKEKDSIALFAQLANDQVDTAALVHNCVREKLQTLSGKKLERLGHDTPFSLHYAKLERKFAEKATQLFNNTLFTGLSLADKVKLFNQAAKTVFGNDAAVPINKKTARADRDAVIQLVQKDLLQGFKAPLAAQQALFKSQPLGFFARMFQKDPLEPLKREITQYIRSSIAQYFAPGTNKQELYKESQILSQQLIDDIQRQYAAQATQDPAIEDLISYETLKTAVDEELKKQLGRRHTNAIQYTKTAADIELALLDFQKANKAAEENPPVRLYKQISFVTGMMAPFTGYVKDKLFLDVFAKCPITAENKELMLLVWQHLMLFAYPTENLPPKQIVERYRLYLQVKDAIPADLRKNLEVFALNKIEKLKKGSSIRLAVENCADSLTKEEDEVLKILAKTFEQESEGFFDAFAFGLGFKQRPEKITEIEKQKVLLFFNSSVGNLRLNKLVARLLPKKESSLSQIIGFGLNLCDESSPLQQKIYAFLEYIKNYLDRDNIRNLTKSESSALRLISYLTWKTRSFDKVEKICEKLEMLIEKYNKNEAILDKDKLTLKEYQALSNLMKTKDFINGQNNPLIKAILTQNEEFNQKILALGAKADSQLGTLDRLFREEGLKHYRQGDVYATEIVRAKAIGDFGFDVRTRAMVRFFGHYTHLGTVVKNGSNTNLEFSEIDSEYQRITFEGSHAIGGDTWRFNPAKVIEGHAINHMINVYGRDWQRKLQQEYEQVCVEVHNGNYSHISNNTERQLKAGAANFIPFGHSGEKITDWIAAMQERLQGEQMFCSEFTLTTTILSIAILNKKLSIKLAEHFKEQNQPHLQNYYENNLVFRMPFPDKIKLESYHPQEAVNLLEKTKGFERLKMPNALEKLINLTV